MSTACANAILGLPSTGYHGGYAGGPKRTSAKRDSECAAGPYEVRAFAGSSVQRLHVQDGKRNPVRRHLPLNAEWRPRKRSQDHRDLLGLWNDGSSGPPLLAGEAQLPGFGGWCALSGARQPGSKNRFSPKALCIRPARWCPGWAGRFGKPHQPGVDHKQRGGLVRTKRRALAGAANRSRLGCRGAAGHSTYPANSGSVPSS